MFRSTHRRPTRLVTLAAAAGLSLGLFAPSLAATAQENSEPATPENVIVMISDGAGYAQFDAARLYETGASYQQVTVDPSTGTIEHEDGTPSQVYDFWPVQIGQSHYSNTGRAEYVTEDAWGDFGWIAEGATDSAAAATALGTGVKTDNGVLGYDSEGNRLLTVGEQAQNVDKKVGLVTTVAFNHATPAGFIAHNTDRNDYHGLATEMIDSGVDVIIGAGHPNYTDANNSRPSHFGPGSWISQPDFERLVNGETPYSFIDSRTQFEAIANGQNVPEKLFGLARVAETFQYNRPGLDRDDVLPHSDPLNTDVPSLETASLAALQVLDEGEDGFFLMVEGGAVDWAGHANQTTRLLEEQIDFNDAVEAVSEWVEENSSWDETLVIVTADHETGYLAGPDAGPDTGWTPLTGQAGELPDVSWHSGGHTNGVVPLYAKGAGSDLLLSRATHWDQVYGAYVDNTGIGQTIFDILGHAPSDSAAGFNLDATVPLEQVGELSLTVPDAGSTIAFDGGGAEQSALLPEVIVNDTRNEVQAQGQGWTVSGVASSFIAGNQSFGSDALAWLPRVLDSTGGATPGDTATLEAPATLAEADRLTRVGTTTIDADLALTVPADATPGRYGSELTLTLFPKD